MAIDKTHNAKERSILASILLVENYEIVYKRITLIFMSTQQPELQEYLPKYKASNCE